MSDTPSLGFGKFVPGFDFLQSLAKGAGQSLPQLPNLSNWVAPTLNVEELEKRLQELRAVHFWLDQNSKALGATIQALEVQKMTLATLQGMNFNMGEVANALKLKPGDALGGGAATTAAPAAGSPPESGAAAVAGTPGKPAAAAKPGKARPKGDGQATGSLVDPLQWWGALTQQFQQIAADALKDVARNTAAAPGDGKGAGAAPAPAGAPATRGAAAKAARKRSGTGKSGSGARKAAAR